MISEHDIYDKSRKLIQALTHLLVSKKTDKKVKWLSIVATEMTELLPMLDALGKQELDKT
jgi:hypothetical protein